MNVPLTRAADGFPRRAFSVAEVVRMVEVGIIKEDERFELIEGEIVPLPRKRNRHEVIRLALTELVAACKQADLRLGAATSLYLSDHTFVEPDLCLYPKRLLPEDVRGTDVLLAIEVSGSSLGYDRGLKGRLYAKHGVQELWVIDTRTRTCWVYTSPQSDGSWTSIEERGAEETLTSAALPGVEITLAVLE